jgi:hypothetical protein
MSLWYQRFAFLSQPPCLSISQAPTSKKFHIKSSQGTRLSHAMHLQHMLSCTLACSCSRFRDAFPRRCFHRHPFGKFDVRFYSPCFCSSSIAHAFSPSCSNFQKFLEKDEYGICIPSGDRFLAQVQFNVLFCLLCVLIFFVLGRERWRQHAAVCVCYVGACPRLLQGVCLFLSNMFFTTACNCKLPHSRAVQRNHTLAPQIPGYKGPSPVKTEEHGLGGSRPKALSGASWQGKA